MIRRSLLLGGGSGRTAISTALHRNPLPISPFKPRWHPPPKNYDPQFGDYPNLPWVPYEKRDPYLKWDDPINRRNFGEPIPEEFDVQDGYFQGEHTRWDNLLKGLYGQAVIAGITLGFLGLAWLMHDPNAKTTGKELPPEVVEYLETKGKDRIVHRKYEVPSVPNELTLVAADPKLPERKTDEFGRPRVAAHAH